jgi:hypothetical protein
MQIQTIIYFVIKMFVFIFTYGQSSTHISTDYSYEDDVYIRRNEEREYDIVGSRHRIGYRVIDETVYINPSFLYAKEQWHIIMDNYGSKQIALIIEILNYEGELVLCLDVLMTAQTFFRFPIELAKKCLIEAAEDDENQLILASDLGRIIGENELYDVPDHTLIIKTIWIRIIQIKWKKKYAERMRKLLMRGSLICQREFELTGRYMSPIISPKSANIKTD